MKAIVYQQYGGPSVFQLKNLSRPVPKSNELLIRIHATTVNSADIRLRKADPWGVRLFFGLLKPNRKVLGNTFAGKIEVVGSAVTKFKPGDDVFGVTGMGFGTYAEYCCLSENAVVAIKPASNSYQQAAAIPFGGITALHFLRKAGVQAGQEVLIYGASGAVGTAAVQLAKFYGAVVTGVCSAHNAELVRSLGAVKTIDHAQQDIMQQDGRYDLIFEVSNKLSYSKCLRLLKPGGCLILCAAGVSGMLRSAWSSVSSRFTILAGMAPEKPEDLRFLKQLIEQGLYKPVVDRSYSLEDMTDAHMYFEHGRKKGNVVITVSDG